MYCQSCQTKLSPKDKSCPTCGRRPGSKRGLGDGSATSAPKSTFPLPPASSADPESSGTSLSETEPRKSGRKPAPAGRKGKRRKPARSAPAPKSPPEVLEGGVTVLPGDVRAMLVERPEIIEDGLRVYSEDGEPIGIALSTEVGEIDLLARDDSGGWIVVAVPEPPLDKEIVGDLLQRMGWVRRHLGKTGEEVRGIVLLDRMPEDLGYAAAAVADSVEFRLYKMALTLEPVVV